MTESDPLLSIVETADLLGVSPATLANWRSSGSVELPRAFMVGRRPRYRRSEVLAWLEEHREEPRVTVA
ncbi:helix-turn-helix transcriptional regulator [Aeromicrobium sp. CF4.19]|uniref:helix-turn-helix transcriptional regulator n=1 Tax=Aeromicrobium sp. CF4.19 TaxID=3373082 RepID=UPI003EE57A50